MYVLSLQGDASVKVRGGTLDVKRLEDVRDDGLEQWRPVVKAEFPVSAADVSTALAALGVEGAALARSDYSLEQLLDEVVRPRDDLRDVAVHKRRAHFSFEGCMAELSELRVEAGSRRTIAVEAEDPERVLAAVRALGFEPRLNVNVPRGLKALVGFGAARYAVIDVGTNSVKFHIGELHADGTWTTVVDRAEVTRLGEGLDATGRLGEEPEGANRRRDRRDGRRGARRRRRGDRRGRHGRPADRGQQRRLPRRRSRAHGRRGGGHLRRGRGAARLSRGDVRPRSVRRLARGLRHRRRQLAVHVRPAGAGRRALQRERRRRAVHGALRSRRRRRRRDARCRARRDRRRARAPGRPAVAGHARRHGRRRHEHRGGEARARALRPERRPGDGSRSRGDRPPDRALPRRGRPSNGARSSASSRTAPRSSSPARASSARCSRSSAATRSR